MLNWGDGTWWIMGSYYLRQWHMRWFEAHGLDGAAVRDISDEARGFSLAGPRSYDLLRRLTHEDVSNVALPFMGCRKLDVGLLRARVARLSVSGELGYEINCTAAEHATLRKFILERGKAIGAFEFGYNALLSLRLEKSFGIWSTEYRQGYTPGTTGLDRFIAFDKGDFIGRDAVLEERNGSGLKSVIVTLEIDADDADASGYEPVWRKGKCIGYVTSGGFGHTTGKSLALAMVDRACATVGNKLSVHIVGVERQALVIPSSPYDPEGKAMRVKVQ